MNGDLSHIRWITIDATGTLIDPYPSVGHVYSRVLARHGFESDHALLQRRFVEQFRSLTKVSRGVVSEASEYAFWKRLVLGVIEPWCSGGDAETVFSDSYDEFAKASNWRAPEGAGALLERLTKQGYRLALLSNADARCRGILKELGLAPWLEQIFLSCEMGFEKPDLRLFRKVEEIIGEVPENILHVGDSARNDGEGPRAAGWQALVIGRDIAALDDLESLLR